MEAIEAPVPEVPAPAPATPSNMQYNPMGGFLRSLETFSTVPLLRKLEILGLFRVWPYTEPTLHYPSA